METAHKNKLKQRFPHLLKDRRVIVLGIPDRYTYMDDELVATLKEKVASYLS
ncbi:hypothetical protein ACFPT7_01495 [Acidicapsa dinghuensis]|uniref:Uncharacterized protein n=1 Tax=Acidicapsa dinghuensis TaxID=2218256 RepID=A0ABW1EAF8_9BACT|nr:hypothetical protein [Acidicapsa dinghuensis]